LHQHIVLAVGFCRLVGWSALLETMGDRRTGCAW